MKPNYISSFVRSVHRKSVRLLIVAVLTSLFCESCGRPGRVLVLSSDYTEQAETDSLLQIIRKAGKQVAVVPIEELTPERLEKVETVVYHRPDSSETDDTEKRLKACLVPFVKGGGSLMLSMEAVRLLNLWEIEPQPVEVEYQDASDHGFGRAVGFHGYREHPIYEGLFGGAYVWKAWEDHKARTLGFSGRNVPRAESAKVLGINWAYIRYHENRKVIWETPVGKGKILAIGGYLYFSMANANRSTLLMFMNNVIDYLSGDHSRFKSKQKYWVYDSIHTQKVDFPDYKITLKEEPDWEPQESPLRTVRKADKRHFWNVAGQQILAMGREQGSIEEIWIHPIMVLRDLSVGIKYKQREEVVWLDKQASQITRSPDYLEREYLLEKGRFREIIQASPENPLMAINYRWDAPDVEHVYVTYTSNLRLMWPYSLNSTGTLFYATAQNGAVTTVFDRERNLNLLAAFDHEPTSYEEGMYDFSHREIREFNRIPAKHKQVSFLYTFAGTPGRLNLYLSGGESGIRQSAELLNATMGRSREVHEASRTHYRNFDKDFLSIRSSDSVFNQAYQWALVSVDKFFCHTPSLGKSMMSGYWTTSRGWNGGHAVSGRPGYAWYFGRDTGWTGIAMTAYGDYEKVKEVLTTFGKHQSPDGKVYHELTTSGSVHYDASDATPLYLVLAGNYLRKSGDVAFIRSQWPHIKKALSFCYSTDTDRDGLIENTNVGHGWQEGWQLYGAHTEVYLAAVWTQALKECAYMAAALEDKETELRCTNDMRMCHRLINENFWNDSLQFFNHGLMRDGTYQEHKCVLGGTPVLFGLADHRKALATARHFSDKYYSTDWGVRMVGYDSPFFALGGYTYGNIWPFHTGCAALAEYRAGLCYQGFRHAYSSLRLFDTWDYGNIAEVILGNKLSFTGICPHQQWSSSMNLLPLYEGMLGMKSDAIKDSLSLAPAFPADWTFAHVRNIRTAERRMGLDYEREDSLYRYVITNESRKPTSMEFAAILPLATEVEQVYIDGEAVPYQLTTDVQNVRVSLNPLRIGEKKEISIKYRGGIGVLTNLPTLYDGMPDEGLRIERESYDPGSQTYTLKVAGKRGKSYDIQLLALSEIAEAAGATFVERKGKLVTYKVEFAGKGEEDFADATIELRLGSPCSSTLHPF
ncbi:GH116 family glycosyl hydrolase [uncultured Bacteroides sp.]|uniref:amylo-alpha-1,6-glucosidase n=2 Tax=uncultured Bacteroides sp. TaxID=162156 RepID=UPI00258D36A6|nr:GH116 family glycosyl hydrolase [uncultured Bacteroides sp.]